MLGSGRKGVLRVALASLALSATFIALPADARSGRLSRESADPKAATAPARKPEGPINVIISIGSQRLWAYDKLGLIETSIVSTGTAGFPTPTGVFAIIDKEEQHYSNIYGGASMPFMQRLTMSGVALHSGATTGRPASHGCIRLPHAFSIKLFRLTRLGARVIIAPNDPVPQDIAHPRLFVPKPMQPDPEEAQASLVRRIAVASGRDMQKSVADTKVVVRHGFRQVFEASATVRDPERPLGTHVFTALEAKADGAAMRWFVVSVPASGSAQTSARRVSRASRSEAEPLLPMVSGPPSGPAEALDRIDLPQDAIDRIAEMVTPGTSFIVSDHGHNREMRAYGTDFILLTR
jgi:hypothetical protein